jgi:hypothetical protein
VDWNGGIEVETILSGAQSGKVQNEPKKSAETIWQGV